MAFACGRQSIRPRRRRIRDSIDEAIAVYEKRYEEILAERRNPDNLKYRKEFLLILAPRFLLTMLNSSRHNQSLQPTRFAVRRHA